MTALALGGLTTPPTNTHITTSSTSFTFLGNGTSCARVCVGTKRQGKSTLRIFMTFNAPFFYAPRAKAVSDQTCAFFFCFLVPLECRH